MINSSATLPVELVADQAMVEALKQAAADASIEVRPSKVPKSSLFFGVAEAAAILALIKGAVEVANLLIAAYKKLKKTQKVVVKTTVGSVTLQIEDEVRADSIAGQLKRIGIN